MDSELRREVILDNFSNPFHKGKGDDEKYKKYNSRNINCIDNIDLYVNIEEAVVKDIIFDGEACAMSTSSTSIMIKNLIGKSINEVKEYITNFTNMVNEEEYEEDILEEAVVFNEVYKQNNRKNCVLLPYKGIIEAIEDYEKEKYN